MPFEIDDKFIDVDFTKQPEYIFGDLGLRAFRSQQRYESAASLIPESEWPSHIEALQETGGGMERLIPLIYNQGSEGSCVGNAAAQAMNIVQAMQVGFDDLIIVSPISIYVFIGSSPQSGAMVDDALTHISKIGALPLDTAENKAKYEHTLPATGYHAARTKINSWPSSWKDTARNLIGIEALEITSVPSLVTASLRGFPIVVGREGHSICYVRPLLRNNSLVFLYVNSWGPWGQAAGTFSKGFGVDTLSVIKKSASWAFALRSVAVIVPPV
jgi:hypothetical protein